jgi:DNA-directed RNA polymerase subunit RPC12/RpoP
MTGNAGIYVGYECKYCNIRSSLLSVVSIGERLAEDPVCDSCGRAMTPVKGQDAPEVLIDFHCKKCGHRSGILTSNIPIKKCPDCGSDIE